MRTTSKLATLCLAAAIAACIVDPAKYTRENPPSADCGNGIVDPDEECDYGVQNSDSSACLPSCRLATCGDGHVYPVFEQCDDGNRSTEACEYGDTSCTVCDANCQEVSGETAFCGDGIIDLEEVCDDHNLSCGTCNSECQDVAWQRAWGIIQAVQGSRFDPDLVETFTLDDGINPPVTFELEVVDNLGGMRPPPVTLGGANVVIPVVATWSADEVAAAISASVNAQSPSLLIWAVHELTAVRLQHSLPTPLGGTVILEDVENSNFEVHGMYVDIGRDCELDEPCGSDEDCLHGCCRLGVCAWCGGGLNVGERVP